MIAWFRDDWCMVVNKFNKTKRLLIFPIRIQRSNGATRFVSGASLFYKCAQNAVMLRGSCSESLFYYPGRAFAQNPRNIKAIEANMNCKQDLCEVYVTVTKYFYEYDSYNYRCVSPINSSIVRVYSRKRGKNLRVLFMDSKIQNMPVILIHYLHIHLMFFFFSFCVWCFSLAHIIHNLSFPSHFDIFMSLLIDYILRTFGR